MDQKLTEEQQRSAHKIIKANRGDCLKESKFFSCINCPNSAYNSGVLCFTSDFPERSKSPAFQAENLRRSQAWLDTHITDAEIMAESPREFCERMVRTEGRGKSIKCERTGKCILESKKYCSYAICFERAKAYLASHPATSQEPPKRRPTPEEMVVGATVRVRLWDEMVRDGKLDSDGDILFQKSASFFNKAMRQFCGTTHKVIKGGGYLHLDGCDDWYFTTDMLDYVEPEKVVEPKTTAVNFFDWRGKKVVFKDGRDNGAQYTICEVIQTQILNEYYFKIKINEFCEPQYSARLFNLCETQDSAKPEPVANTPKPEAKEKLNTTVKGDVDKLPLGLLRIINFRDLLPTDALRIIALEGQVDDLTKKLAASARKCERQQRRLRAKWEATLDGEWEAARDDEMATREEIGAWWSAGKGSVTLRDGKSTIRPKGHSSWIPATRGNLKI